MKKLSILTITAIIWTLSSCTNKNELIAQKWLVEETVISEQKLSGELVSGFFLDIRKDGSYILSGMSTERGKWSLSAEKDSLITVNEENRKIAYFIKELTKERLVLYDNSLGTDMVTSFKK